MYSNNNFIDVGDHSWLAFYQSGQIIPERPGGKIQKTSANTRINIKGEADDSQGVGKGSLGVIQQSKEIKICCENIQRKAVKRSPQRGEYVFAQKDMEHFAIF